MATEIVWTERAVESFRKNVEYLQTHWTGRETEAFLRAVEEKLNIVAAFPSIFLQVDKRKRIHRVLISEQIALFYRNNKRKKRIELLLFWDSRRDPDGLSL